MQRSDETKEKDFEFQGQQIVETEYIGKTNGR